MNQNLLKKLLTHHLPSPLCIDEKYKNAGPINCGNASNLNQLIAENNIDLWLCGHTHSSFDFEYENTRFVCNPEGYKNWRNHPENVEFNPKLILEV